MEDLRNVLGTLSVAVQSMAIDAYIPASLRRDAQTQIAKAENAGGSVRLIRLPINDMEALKARLARLKPTQPYRPLLLGLPVDYSPFPWLEVVTVFKDNTNTHNDNAGRLLEEWKPTAPSTDELVTA